MDDDHAERLLGVMSAWTLFSKDHLKGGEIDLGGVNVDCSYWY